MKSEKIRKDIHLSEEAIEMLQLAADKESRSLKNYIEKLLVKQADKIKNGLQQTKV